MRETIWGGLLLLAILVDWRFVFVVPAVWFLGEVFDAILAWRERGRILEAGKRP